MLWILSRFKTVILSASCFALMLGLAHADPRHVYLTWEDFNTHDNITVNYQTLDDNEESHVYYDTVSHAPAGGYKDYKQHASGKAHKIPGLAEVPDLKDANRTIHWVKLEGLRGGETYYFIAGDEKSGFTKERKFRTVPENATKMRFVTGGDMGTGDGPRTLEKHAAALSPDFVAVGGDIHYENGALKRVDLVDMWLDAWQEIMVTPQGFTVPMVLAIGNHEVIGGFGQGKVERATYWHGFYAQAGDKSYFTRKFGKDVLLMALDSGHIVPHAMQTEWMEEQFEKNKDLPIKFAIYHVPLYPSHRPFEGLPSKMARDAWGPIFDKHNLTAGFENHDHSFKRTKLIKGNKVDETGTLFIGDGCFGRGARPVPLTRLWYEQKAASIQHFWQIDINEGQVEYRAINNEGKVFDVYPPSLPGALSAGAVFHALVEKSHQQGDPGD